MEKPIPALEAKPDLNGSADEISAQYETPTPEPFISFNALKDRIRHHYEICSDYYYSLWYISNSPPLHSIRERHMLNNKGASTSITGISSSPQTRKRRRKSS
jgi:hypothetical protein